MSGKPIALLDLKAQYETIRPEIHDAIDRVVQSQRFVLGPEVEALEVELAEYCEARHAIGVSSGSDALLVALMALDVGPGDEIITSPYTFFATGGSIARLGATPVFVDIDPVTFNIDPAQIEARVTSRTKGIIPVHLFGQCADMDAVNRIAGRHSLFVIEDAAQAIGAEYGGRRAGSLGTVACFSFFPSKNLGAFGDGGAVTTNDSALAEKIGCLRGHGAKPKYHHSMIGGNFRLDALQAAVLRVKLKYLDLWSATRQRNAALYTKAFAAEGLTDSLVSTPVAVQDRHIYNQYVVRLTDRDAVQAELKSRKIGCEIYYPIPLHLQRCFADCGHHEGDMPESEAAAASTLALPIYPELTPGEQHQVVQTIAGHYEQSGKHRRSKAA